MTTPSTPPASLPSVKLIGFPQLLMLSLALNTLISVALLIGGFWQAQYYGIGSILSVLWLASYSAPLQKAPLMFGLSFFRMITFSFLVVWLGNFSLDKSTVVLIGCFSYKLIIMANVFLSCIVWCVARLKRDDKRA